MAKKEQKEVKPAPILIQLGIFTTILFISSVLSSLMPKSFPVPTPVIGLVLLYLLLTLKIVKVEWVDSFGGFMISIIGFLFVPSGISLAGSLDIMAKQGVQIVLVVVISTVIMLVVTTYVAWLLISIRKKISKKNHQMKGGAE